MGRLRSAAGCPGFPRLLGAYAVNELGDSFGLIALSLLVFDRTGDPLATAALFLVSKFVPALIAPLATARLDRMHISRAGPAIYLAEAAVFGVLAMLGEHMALGAVLALALLDGALALTGRSLIRAATASVLLAHDRLRDGNSAMNLVFAVAATAGPALAGLLVDGAGVGVALGADAISFVAAGAVLAFARPEASVPGAGAGAGERWVQRLRDGLAYVRSAPVVGGLVGAEAVALMFFTLVTPVEVVYAQQTLHAGSAGFGALMASWGLGIVAGGLIFASTPRLRPRVLIEVSTALIALSYLLLAVSPGLLVACLVSVVGGLGNGVQWISVMTEIQQLVPEDLQARVIALLESVAAATPGIGFVAGGTIAALLSARAAYTVASAGVLVSLVLLMRVLRRAPDTPVQVAPDGLPSPATAAGRWLADG